MTHSATAELYPPTAVFSMIWGIQGHRGPRLLVGVDIPKTGISDIEESRGPSDGRGGPAFSARNENHQVRIRDGMPAPKDSGRFQTGGLSGISDIPTIG